MLRVRHVKSSVLIIMLVMVMIILTACSTKLSGTYSSKGIITQSFTFKEDDVVVISAFGIDAEGTYVIKDEKIIITYRLFNLSYDFEKSFKKDGNSIFIGGTEFIKE